MLLRVLALDYDNTISIDGVLPAEVRLALAQVREQGLVVILVTGRLLADLRLLIGDLGVFDAVVAENGALLHLPHSASTRPLAAAPTPALLSTLRARGLAARAGSCIVEFDADGAATAIDVVRALQLPLALHFNGGRAMLLPLAVSKATGLRAALRALRLSAHNAIGVGDAENDHELLSTCEIGYAVAWGSAALQAAADGLVVGSGPAAIAGWIRRITATGSIQPPVTGRRRVVLGRADDGSIATLPMRSGNVLVLGDAGSGKSWLAGLICEQLLAEGYSLCVFDAEGDYGELEAMPAMLRLGGDDPPPSMPELARVLRHADVSVLIDLSHLQLADKQRYVAGALQLLNGLRRRSGLPHRILLDEAHYFLSTAAGVTQLDREHDGHILVSYRLTDLHADVLAMADTVIVTRETDPEAVAVLHHHRGGGGDVATWQRQLAKLELDEAVMLPMRDQADAALRRFRVAPRQTLHVRHRRKYFDMPVPAPYEFRFQLCRGGDGPQARSLQELVDVLAAVPTAELAGHIMRGDFSRWLRDVVKDEVLAQAVAGLEARHRTGSIADFNGAVIHAVHGRYHVADDLLQQP